MFIYIIFYIKYICIIENDNNSNDDPQLIYACKIGDEIKVKQLIKDGTDINQQNSEGDTPLICACYKNNH